MLFQNTGLTRAMYQFFQTLIYVAPATLFAVSLHEFAHGYVSYKLGDMTPKYDADHTENGKTDSEPDTGNSDQCTDRPDRSWTARNNYW